MHAPANPLLDALGQTFGHLSDNLGQLAGRAASGVGGAFGGRAGSAAGASSSSSSAHFAPSATTTRTTTAAAIGRSHYEQQQRARVLSPGCWVPPVAVSSGRTAARACSIERPSLACSCPIVSRSIAITTRTTHTHTQSISGAALGGAAGEPAGGRGLGAALGALWNNPLTGGGGGSSAAAPAATTAAARPAALAAQPLYQLGMAREEVKARLAPIPVYTVANPKNEFVLVAGEVGRGGSLPSAAAPPAAHPCPAR
jgi:hypothetical protein